MGKHDHGATTSFAESGGYEKTYNNFRKHLWKKKRMKKHSWNMSTSWIFSAIHLDKWLPFEVTTDIHETFAYEGVHER